MPVGSRGGGLRHLYLEWGSAPEMAGQARWDPLPGGFRGSSAAWCIPWITEGGLLTLRGTLLRRRALCGPLPFPRLCWAARSPVEGGHAALRRGHVCVYSLVDESVRRRHGPSWFRTREALLSARAPVRGSAGSLWVPAVLLKRSRQSQYSLARTSPWGLVLLIADVFLC